MTKYVVLYTAGGELDREPVTNRLDIATSEAVQRLASRCVLEVGDRIVIEDDET